MNTTDAERIISEFIKPVFAFALKRCRNIGDAEDLSQDILLKVYKALLKKDDINNVPKYTWTIAHNSLANYYRDNKKSSEIVSLDDIGEKVFEVEEENAETVKRLQSEIRIFFRRYFCNFLHKISRVRRNAFDAAR